MRDLSIEQQNQYAFERQGNEFKEIHKTIETLKEEVLEQHKRKMGYQARSFKLSRLIKLYLGALDEYNVVRHLGGPLQRRRYHQLMRLETIMRDWGSRWG